MSAPAAPTAPVRGLRGIVATADQLATRAGIAALGSGGNAVDAAIAANAVMAVVGPHQCGMGGDLFALVHTGRSVVALNAGGRAGSGADPDALRAEGHTAVPDRHDVRAVTIPGCVDGWTTLHARFGSIPLADLLAPAVRLAQDGFPASPLLASALARLDRRGQVRLEPVAPRGTVPGALLRRPGVARALRAVAAEGRAGFYEGEFGAGLRELGDGLFSAADLAAGQAEWDVPLSSSAFDVELHTIGPPSQGYLTLGAARLASAAGLPDDPDDPQWAHLLVECATAAAFDRPQVLHERADGRRLLAAIDGRAPIVDRQRASHRRAPAASGDTTYLCAADESGMAVSLIQSNAAGFGSWLVEPSTGINLHNRGLGFNLEPGHPAELGPRRRPPSTLSPALATRAGELVAVFGTMGGDAQPQILLQLAARLFRHGADPDVALSAGRWFLRGPASGFETWTAPEDLELAIEGHAPGAWRDDLARRGHRVVIVPSWDGGFGHAHAILVEPTGMLAGSADPRTVVGACAAL